MKKIVSTALAIILVASIASGCSKETGSSSEPPQNNPSSNNSTTSQNGSNNSAGESILPNKFKIPGKAIAMDSPNYQEINKGYTNLFNVNGVKFIAITAAKDTASTTLSDVEAQVFSIFANEAKNYYRGGGGVELATLKISKEEEKTVSGISTIRFEGTLEVPKKDGGAYTSFAVGYFFIMDNTPCQILGTVVSEGQETEIITEITTYVDAMAQSLRSEK